MNHVTPLPSVCLNLARTMTSPQHSPACSGQTDGSEQPIYLDEDGPNHPDVLDFGIPNLVEDDECPQPVEPEDIDDPRNGWL